MRVPVAAVTAVLTTVLLAGCTQTPAKGLDDSGSPVTSAPGEPAADGPVQIGNNPGQTCMPPSRTGELTMGFDAVRSTASDPVTITAVTLEGDSGVRVADSYLMPVRHMNLIGVAPSWPPQTTGATSRDWAARVPAVGENRLAHLPGVRVWNLVLKLTTDPTVSTPGYRRVALAYTTGGKQYLTRSGTGLVLTRPC